MSIFETAILFFSILNKVAVVGIALWSIWALQVVFTDDKWTDTYPFLKSWLVRLSIALIAAGFAIDALSMYTPSVSEVVMNIGILILMHLFRFRYKRNKRVTNSQQYES